MRLLLAIFLSLACLAMVSPPPVRISTSNPLTSQVDLPGDGTAFLNSQVEDHIAVNPANSQNIVCGVQQDRWGSGAARAPVAGVSLDGGETFRPVVIPQTTLATGGPFDRMADPWIAFSSTGRVFFANVAGILASSFLLCSESQGSSSLNCL